MRESFPLNEPYSTSSNADAVSEHLNTPPSLQLLCSSSKCFGIAVSSDHQDFYTKQNWREVAIRMGGGDFMDEFPVTRPLPSSSAVVLPSTATCSCNSRSPSVSQSKNRRSRLNRFSFSVPILNSIRSWSFVGINFLLISIILLEASR